MSLFTANCRRNVYLAVSTGICARKATLPRERILAYRLIAVLGLCIQNRWSYGKSRDKQPTCLKQPFERSERRSIANLKGIFHSTFKCGLKATSRQKPAHMHNRHLGHLATMTMTMIMLVTSSYLDQVSRTLPLPLHPHPPRWSDSDPAGPCCDSDCPATSRAES